jgi:hypothetical protein
VQQEEHGESRLSGSGVQGTVQIGLGKEEVCEGGGESTDIRECPGRVGSWLGS